MVKLDENYSLVIPRQLCPSVAILLERLDELEPQPQWIGLCSGLVDIIHVSSPSWIAGISFTSSSFPLPHAAKPHEVYMTGVTAAAVARDIREGYTPVVRQVGVAMEKDGCPDHHLGMRRDHLDENELTVTNEDYATVFAHVARGFHGTGTHEKRTGSRAYISLNTKNGIGITVAQR